MKLSKKIIQHFYFPRLDNLDKEIGYKLIFHKIPDRYINGVISCEMTRTWQNFGLDIVKGKNHFTIGRVINSISTRFDADSSQYQSWLGGYTVKLASEKMITVEDHFKLAIADQNSWLKWYGDPNPLTTIDDFKAFKVGELVLGKYTGIMYEFGCRTHRVMWVLDIIN